MPIFAEEMEIKEVYFVRYFAREKGIFFIGDRKCILSIFNPRILHGYLVVALRWERLDPSPYFPINNATEVCMLY